ncbi:MAG: hypothetical protein ACLFPI_06400 [Desulfobacterales bacterium]
MATLVATVIRLSGLHACVPDFLIDAIRMVGHMALPLLMIILGGSIYVDCKDDKPVKSLFYRQY